MRRLALALSCALLALAAPAVTAAPVHARTATAVHDGTQEARLGFGSRGLGYRRYSSRRSSRYPGHGTRPRRSRGFLRGLFHGLFWGWVLSHFFGGGFPLVLPLLLLVLLVAMTRRRRPPAPYRW
jgi:predicted lipid-binding transport protein (Tim44 family)